jgi:hypothetical protein
MKNTCTLLNVTGDVTIGWDNETSHEVKKWIQEKLDDGCHFFIIEKKFKIFNKEKLVKSAFDLPQKGEVKLKDDEASKFIKSTGAISMRKVLPTKEKTVNLGDESANNLVNNGKANHVPKDKSFTHKVKKVSKCVAEIASNHTICSRRMVGG